MKEKLIEIEQKAQSHLEQFFNQDNLDAIWNIQTRATKAPNGEYVKYYEPLVEKLERAKFNRDIKELFFSQKQFISQDIINRLDVSKRLDLLDSHKSKIENLFDVSDNSYYYQVPINYTKDESKFIDFDTFGIKGLVIQKSDNSYSIPNNIECIDLRPIRQLLCNIKLWNWLNEELTKVTPITANNLNINSYIIWNGGKNTLADLFYQLKQLVNNENKPLLDANNTDIARFLKNNFNAFNETEISTIKGYLEKEDKRPKKSTSKLTIIEGFPPSD